MVAFSVTPGSDPPLENQLARSTGLEIVRSGQLLHVKVMGKLSGTSHCALAAAVDQQVRQHGKVCLLLEFRDRNGWRATALWQNETLDFKVESVDHSRLDEAKIWLENHIASFCKTARAKEQK